MIVLIRRLGRSLNPPDLSQKTVLITGASSGFGYVTALYLAERGHRVIGTSRSLSRLSKLQDRANKDNLQITPVELDINSDEAVGEATPTLIDRYGPIDVLVNNAGYGLWGPLESLTVEELKTQYETNVFAVHRMTNAVLPNMIERRSGIVINISSVLGRLGTPFNGAYSSSKFALEGMSEALRTELLPFGVRVVLVEPGLFRTEFQNNQIVGSNVRFEGGVYSPYIKKYQSAHDQFDRFGSDPVKFARLMHEIIQSPNPAFRYALGTGAKAGIMGKRLLPERLFNKLLSTFTLRE